MNKKVLSLVLAITMALTSIVVLDTSEAQAAGSSTYWLKVNKQANVVTAYKYIRGKYRPYRAMLISSGGSNTPSGTFYTGYKARWNVLMGPVWGQYCTVITGDYLFHSVWYYQNGKKNTVSGTEYNYLGQSRSHGCVRLAVMDAKWIYENCGRGTKVTIYSSSNPGPLGKPKGIKISSGPQWDPTDPDPHNPNFRLKKAVLKISKKKARQVQYGKKYSLKKGVTAKNINAYQNLTSKVKVAKIRKYKKGRLVKARFSTKSLGTYKITYKVHDKYCRGTTYKSMKLKVVDTVRPTIKAKSRTVKIDSRNAVYGMSARQKTAGRTGAVTTYIKAPGTAKYTAYNYRAAKAYSFNKVGRYTIKYVVKNKYKPYRAASKVIYVNCKAANAVISVDPSNILATDQDTVDTLAAKVRAATVIKDNKKRGDASKATISFDKQAPYTAGDTVSVTLKYKGRNHRTVTKIVKIIIGVADSGGA